MLRIEANGKQIKHIVTNHPMTDDEAYALVGEIIKDEENERVYVVIDGVKYEYDDLSTTQMPTVAEVIAREAPWCADWEIYKVRKDACNDSPLMSCFGIPNEYLYEECLCIENGVMPTKKFSDKFILSVRIE